MVLRIESNFGGWTTGLLLAVVSMMGDVLCAGAISHASGWDLVLPMTFYVCQLSLLAIWLGLGDSHLAIRLLTAIPAGFAVIWLSISHETWNDSDLERPHFLWYWLVVPMMALPSLAMRAAGLRITRVMATPLDNGHRGPVQYSLRQVFELTAVVALAALAVRVCYQASAAPPDEEGWSRLEAMIIRLNMTLLGIAAISAPCTAWLTLSSATPIRRRVALFLLLVAVADVAALGAMLMFLTNERSGPVEFDQLIEIAVRGALFIAACLTATSTALLLFRRRRYRLIRISPGRALLRLMVMFTIAVASLGGLPVAFAAEPAASRPLMHDFIGVNGHTIQFKPELYAKVCRQVRDYHSFAWDMGRDTDFAPRFPEARNRVNWDTVYGSWKKAGFETDVCLMFNETPPDSWKDLSKDARAYGLAFAKAFGPSSAKRLVSACEIGNEPGNYSDEQYRSLFQAMASGLREGDPKLRIATCNLTTGKSGKYEKSVACVQGLESLYDVANIHTYAMAEGWPTWRRSYPEDPKIEFLKSVEALIAWRNDHAKGKQVWVTEFGWDASTKPNLPTGDFAKWKGNVSDEKQAQYLVRALLLFASMDVNRAYLYFFNDSDEPSFHASSGITRNFQPKPSFYAVGHLERTLGDYRFSQVLMKKEGLAYAMMFDHATDSKKKILVAWSPTGSGRSGDIDLPIGKSRVVRAEKMPLTAADAPRIQASATSGSLHCLVEESLTYFLLEE